MNETQTPTILDRIQAKLLELATACARGQMNPGALAREAFTLGVNIGRADERARQARELAEGEPDEQE